MIQSMTGYGRSEKVWRNMSMKVEARSLNHRFCDITVRLPEGLMRLDAMIRKAISERFSRGKFDITLKIIRADTILDFPDREILGKYKDVVKNISQAFGVDFHIRQDIGFSDLLALKGLTSSINVFYDVPGIEKVIMDMVNKSLHGLERMRSREGTHICKDIKKRLDRIDKYLNKIKRLQPQIRKSMEKRYLERMKALGGSSGVDMDKVYQEIAMIIEKTDITEEIVRIESHLKQFRNKMDKGGVVGRSLDFILQEIHREVNTIAAKTGDARVSQIVVDMKTETERIREQVHNIE